MIKAFAILLGLCLVAGCSADLTSVRYRNGAVLPSSALPYALPKATIVVTTTYALNACENDASGRNIKITVSSAVATTLSADDAMRFYVDYAAMRGPMKDVGVALDLYPQGTLKGLNANATNQTLNTIVAAGNAALSGLIAISKAGIAAAGVAPGSNNFCKDPTQQQVDDLAKAQQQLKKAKTALTNDQATLAGLAGGDAAAIKKAQDAVTADTAEVSVENDAVTTAQAKLTIVTVQRITPTIADFDGTATRPYPLQPTKVADTWFTDLGKAFLKSEQTTIDATTQQVAVSLDAVPFKASPAPPSAIPDIDTSTGKSASFNGLAVRFPVTAHVKVCGGECPDPSSIQIVNNQTTTETDVLIPQLGPPVAIELNGNAIQSSTLAVTAATDGTISNVTTKDTSTLTQIFNTISGAFTSLSTQENTAVTAQAAAQNAQNGAVTAQTSAATAAAAANDNALKAQADCLNQAKAILAAGAVPVAKCQ